jgi:starvation-inducible outer membrane lipoprotein
MNLQSVNADVTASQQFVNTNVTQRGGVDNIHNCEDFLRRRPDTASVPAHRSPLIKEFIVITKHTIVGLCMAVPVFLGGCASNSPFPPELQNKVTPTFDFQAWRDASPSNPGGKSDAGAKVELGGRIVQATKNDKGVLIVAEQLPIVKHPVYGPSDSGDRKGGEYEFAFLYPGELAPEVLRFGNRFVVIGTTSGRKHVVVDGAPKTEPYLVADCVHVWQTGRADIADFKEGVGAGNSPLPETTSCATKKH